MKITKKLYTIKPKKLINNTHKRKQYLVIACLLISSASHSVISPKAKQSKEIYMASHFIKTHPLVLDGLQKIEAYRDEPVTVLYNYQDSTNYINKCKAKAKRKKILSTENINSFESNCPVDYK